jgi:hypothetical protein
MRIFDYETNRDLNDVELHLTPQEVEDLIAYLATLKKRPELQKVHLSEVVGSRLEREITVLLDRPKVLVQIA